MELHESGPEKKYLKYHYKLPHSTPWQNGSLKNKQYSIKNALWGWECSSVVKHLPTMWNGPVFKPQDSKRKKKFCMKNAFKILKCINMKCAYEKMAYI